MAKASRVGKRGRIVIPAELRKRYGLEEGALVVAEAREDGVLLRPAEAGRKDAAWRQRLMEEANAGYAALRADEQAWAAWQREIEELDATLGDGLEEWPWDGGYEPADG